MTTTTYYSDEDNPVGSRRALREFCRRRGVRTHRAGRRLLVVAAELDAAIVGTSPPATAIRTAEDELLERAGLRVTGGR